MTLIEYLALEALPELRVAAETRDHLEWTLSLCYDGCEYDSAGVVVLCRECYVRIPIGQRHEGHKPTCLIGKAERFLRGCGEK